jgi:hypothetical protein
MKPLYQNTGLFITGCIINGSMVYRMIQDNTRNNEKCSKIEESSRQTHGHVVLGDIILPNPKPTKDM